MESFVEKALQLYDDQVVLIEQIKTDEWERVSSEAAADGDDDDENAASERQFVGDLARFMWNLCNNNTADKNDESETKSTWLQPEHALRFARGCKFRQDFAEKKFTKFARSVSEFGYPVEPPALLQTGMIRALPGARDFKGRQVISIKPAAASEAGHIEELGERARMIHVVLDKLLDDAQTQVLGFVGVINFQGAGMSIVTSDRELLRAAADFLHKCVPARFAKLYVVNAPWFFKMVVQLMKLLVSAKMMARLKLLDEPDQLLEFMDKESLPDHLGGTQSHEEFMQWIEGNKI